MKEQNFSQGPTRFVIGIDSDGTVFDTMRVKHQKVFLPVAMEVWELFPFEQDLKAIWEEINLYSIHRGVNRFQALGMAFQRLARRSEEAHQALAGYEDLIEFLASTDLLSPQSVAAFNETKRSPFLERVLDWSKRSDALYQRILEEEGNPPYPSVRESLTRASHKAEVVVVSSASRKALLSEWGEAELLPLTSQVAGQEAGSKKAQLESILRGDKGTTRALMIGDAPGDLEAARAHGICFYPIIPGDEATAWKRFEEEAMNRFFEGTYEGSYEEALLADFERVLRPDEFSEVAIETELCVA